MELRRFALCILLNLGPMSALGFSAQEGGMVPTRQRPSQLADVASAEIGTRIRKLLPHANDRKRIRLAILPPGDSDGVVSPLVSETSGALEGHLFERLQALAKVQPLQIFGGETLRQHCRDAGLDWAKLLVSDPTSLASLFKAIDLDVVVTARLRARSAQELADAKAESFQVEFQILALEGGTTRADGFKLTADSQLLASPSDRAVPSGRFRFELLIDGRPVPLQRVKGPKDYRDAMVAELDPVVVNGRKPVRYSLRFTNLGSPEVGWLNENDARRLFGLAIGIDGVSWALQPSSPGSSVSNFVRRDPYHTPKLILTGPGDELVPAVGGGHLLQSAVTRGDGATKDGATWELRGFQDGLNLARAFTFGAPEGAVAVKSGTQQEVGLIWIHVFPQRLPGDKRDQKLLDGSPLPASREVIGTGAVGTIKQEVFPVKLDMYEEYVESCRIYYYVRGTTRAIPVQF